MIIGLGIDAVDSQRCAQWHTYSHKTLSRLFSPEEIAYCLQNPKQSAQRFAIRFAAREAFFKAWSQAFANQPIPLLRLCRAMQVIAAPATPPQIQMNWSLLGIKNPEISILLTQTHSDLTAIACVILQK